MFQPNIWFSGTVIPKPLAAAACALLRLPFLGWWAWAPQPRCCACLSPDKLLRTPLCLALFLSPQSRCQYCDAPRAFSAACTIRADPPGCPQSRLLSWNHVYVRTEMRIPFSRSNDHPHGRPIGGKRAPQHSRLSLVRTLFSWHQPWWLGVAKPGCTHREHANVIREENVQSKRFTGYIYPRNHTGWEQPQTHTFNTTHLRLTSRWVPSGRFSTTRPCHLCMCQVAAASHSLNRFTWVCMCMHAFVCMPTCLECKGVRTWNSNPDIDTVPGPESYPAVKIAICCIDTAQDLYIPVLQVRASDVDNKRQLHTNFQREIPIANRNKATFYRPLFLSRCGIQFGPKHYIGPHFVLVIAVRLAKKTGSGGIGSCWRPPNQVQAGSPNAHRWCCSGQACRAIWR